MEEPAPYNTKAPDYAGLLAKVTRLTMRADSADWAMQDVQAENRLLRAGIDALTTRALKAEARVKEQQAELGEQEVDMLRLIQENMTRII